MKSQPKSVAAYLKSLPADRRKALEAVRKVIRANIDPAFEEGIQYGMVGYYVPHSLYPDGYHCDPKQPLPFASLASQKNHMALYLFCIYGNGDEEAWFRKAWTGAGKKLDMGKSCVRFKKLEDVPLDVVAELFQRVSARDFIAFYEEARSGGSTGKPKRKAAKKTTRKAAAKKTTRKAAAKKTTRKATAKKTTRKATAKKTTRKAAAKKATRKATGTRLRKVSASSVKKAGARKTARKASTAKKRSSKARR